MTTYVIALASDTTEVFVVPENILPSLSLTKRSKLQDQTGIESITMPVSYPDAGEPDTLEVVEIDMTAEELQELIVAQAPLLYNAYGCAETLSPESVEEWMSKLAEVGRPVITELLETSTVGPIQIEGIPVSKNIPSKQELDLVLSILNYITQQKIELTSDLKRSEALTRYCPLTLWGDSGDSTWTMEMRGSIIDWSLLQAMEHQLALSDEYPEWMLLDLASLPLIPHRQADRLRQRADPWRHLNYFAGFNLGKLDLTHTYLTGPIMLVATDPNMEPRVIDDWMPNFFTEVVSGDEKEFVNTSRKYKPSVIKDAKGLLTVRRGTQTLQLRLEPGLPLVLVVDEGAPEDTERDLMKVIKAAFPGALKLEDGVVINVFRPIHIRRGSILDIIRSPFSCDRGWITGNGDQRRAVVTPSCLLTSGKEADGAVYLDDSVTEWDLIIYNNAGVPVVEGWSRYEIAGREIPKNIFDEISAVGVADRYYPKSLFARKPEIIGYAE